MKSFIRFTTPIALSMAAFVTQAQAHSNRSSHDLDDLRPRVQAMHNYCSSHAPKPRPSQGNQAPLVTVQCGDIITQSIRVANDLNCPDTTGFALSVKSDSVKVDGNGHSISAPNAAAGIYVEGSNVSITNFKVRGVANGSGILAYDTPGLNLTKNDFSQNGTGIVIYAEKTDMTNVKILNNKAEKNTLFGIRSGQDGDGSIISPQISGNDFSDSGSYAMRIQADRFDLDFTDNNDLQNSQNGIYLKDGVFSLKGLTLSGEKIVKAAIFVDSAESIDVDAVDVSSILPANGNQERIGLDLYRVKKFNIKGLLAFSNDVGLKLETEQGVSPSGSVRCSFFMNAAVAAIMITSYDSTPYGNLDLDNGNYFKLLKNTVKILTSPGTIWSAI